MPAESVQVAEPAVAGRDGLLARLLPSDVVTRETTGDLLTGTRFRVEEAAVAAAVESRRREFRTTRACARLALRELGLAEVAIPRGAWGEPGWPAAVVGSLTHCPGYRAAAVGWRRRHRSIGIDAEPSAPLPAEVLTMIADPLERARLAKLLDDDPTVPWDRLLFSAKESVYKARFPVTGQWLDFGDLRVIIDPAGGFSARVHCPAPGGFEDVDVLHGRWAVEAGILATAVVW